ncbi:helix-turn-helix domain-containing protein [Streptomyces sp. NPDC007901]|uniref:helix-turn-helix domain-containing protein n=1 Tax=Streptomyces sp. NPDC007901 TaxID=3364785 RepID=UPI0036E31A8F
METTTRLGSVGQRVAKEVARLRGRTTVRELSARLAKLGRPILPSGITKIEQGSRRVDADDLVALAVALKVTPTRLLLGPPPTGVDEPDDPAHDEIWEWHPWTDSAGNDRAPIPVIRLLPELALEPWDAWTWATGDIPLGDIWKLVDEEQLNTPEGEQERFRAQNQLPVVRPILNLHDDLQAAVAQVGAAVMNALDLGLTEEQIDQVVAQSFALWRKEMGVRKANADRLKKAQEGDENGPKNT